MDVTAKKIMSSDLARAVERALNRSRVVIHITESQRQAILLNNASKDAKRR